MAAYGLGNEAEGLPGKVDVRRQERQWEMLKQHLGAESRGDPPRPFASTRTLFGIKSTVERQLDEYVAREEELREAKRRAVEGADSDGDGSERVAADGEE